MIGHLVRDPDLFFWRRLSRQPFQVFDAIHEFDKTVVGVPFVVPKFTGQTVLRLSYSVPDLLLRRNGSREYHLLVQKQAGSEPLGLAVRVDLAFGSAEAASESLRRGESGLWRADLTLRRDAEFTIRFP